jgi:pilus assembly protein Flp/PilA
MATTFNLLSAMSRRLEIKTIFANAPKIFDEVLVDLCRVFRPESTRFRRNEDNPMKLMKDLVCNEEGGEVLEYALIAGLIIVGAIAAVTAVGNRVLARWTSIQNSI